MNLSRRTASLAGILIVLTVFLICSHAKAQVPIFNVQKNGTPQFSTNFLQHADGSTLYNFCDLPNCATVPPPSNQLIRANITYVGHSAAVAPNVDLTNWNVVWGRIQASEPGWAWPATRGATPQWTMRANQFTCTQFTTTATTGLNQLGMSSYNTAGNLDVTISRACGDFTAWTAVYIPPTDPTHPWALGGPGCVKSGIGAFASAFQNYRLSTSTVAFCGLAPRSTYFLNIRFKDGTPFDPMAGTRTPLCGALGCKVAIISNTSPGL